MVLPTCRKYFKQIFLRFPSELTASSHQDHSAVKLGVWMHTAAHKKQCQTSKTVLIWMVRVVSCCLVWLGMMTRQVKIPNDKTRANQILWRCEGCDLWCRLVGNQPEVSIWRLLNEILMCVASETEEGRSG